MHQIANVREFFNGRMSWKGRVGRYYGSTLPHLEETDIRKQRGKWCNGKRVRKVTSMDLRERPFQCRDLSRTMFWRIQVSGLVRIKKDRFVHESKRANLWLTYWQTLTLLGFNISSPSYYRVEKPLTILHWRRCHLAHGIDARWRRRLWRPAIKDFLFGRLTLTFPK